MNEKVKKRILLTAAMISFFGVARLHAQSEHARKIAASFVGTPYERYATDLLVNKPDYVVFTPKKADRRPPPVKAPVPANASNAITGDTYNDHFQVFDKPNGTLFAVWTQATRESDIDQHIAFSKSTDKGLTWSAPIILAGSSNYAAPHLRASWQQPMVSASGRIYVLWNQQTSNRGPHCGRMFGVYSDNDGETWSSPKEVSMKRMDRDPKTILTPPSWCNWQRPLRLGAGGRYLVAVTRHGKADYDETEGPTVEFLQFDNIDDDPEVFNIHLSWFATNKNALKIVDPKFGSCAEEASIVKLPDGRLFAMMRTYTGHPYWSQSRDAGVTWSQPKVLLDHDGGTAWLQPCSPCPIYDWKGPEAASGLYFALIHNAFDFNARSAHQRRGPVYLIAGKFNPKAEQPIEFAPAKLFAGRANGNSFYSSYTIVDGKGVLWFPDDKFYLLGRVIGPEWFADVKP